MKVSDKCRHLAGDKFLELTPVERIAVIRAYKNGERKLLQRICKQSNAADFVFIFRNDNETTKRNYLGVEI